MTAGHHLDRATYSGEFGFLMIHAKSDPARYDQEIFWRCTTGKGTRRAAAKVIRKWCTAIRR